ncbi:MAG: porin, partial [Gemmobacter sp.]|uniref:porin n=1 Tax=Gemmobacter sp. TaxID=1898957 RepID=UPI001A505310
RVVFDLSAESDNGLSFGASFRADQAGDDAEGGAKGNTDMGKGTIWVSGGFGKLAMGDVVSAGEAALGDLSGVGYTGLGDFSDIPYINGDDGNDFDGTGALYSYSAGAIGFHLGMTDGSDNDPTTVDADASYSIGASYGTDAYSVALAYLSGTPGNDTAEEIILGGSGNIGAAKVKAYYADFKNTAIEKSFGLSVDYGMDATTLTAFVRRDDLGATDADTFGLGVAYDLGGGAALKAGVVDSDYLADTVADLGITMSF